MQATDWVKSHKRHISGSLLLAGLVLPELRFILAYAGLPRLWSHHEHKKGKAFGDAVAYTAQDIPGDPINLKIEGSGAAIEAALQRAGWVKAEDVSLASGLKIGVSVLFFRPYPDAPVSPLFFNDKKQTFAYQHDEGRSADAVTMCVSGRWSRATGSLQQPSIAVWASASLPCRSPTTSGPI